MLSKSSVAGIAEQILVQLIATVAESSNDHTNNTEWSLNVVRKSDRLIKNSLICSGKIATHSRQRVSTYGDAQQPWLLPVSVGMKEDSTQAFSNFTRYPSLIHATASFFLLLKWNITSMLYILFLNSVKANRIYSMDHSHALRSWYLLSCSENSQKKVTCENLQCIHFLTYNKSSVFRWKEVLSYHGCFTYEFCVSYLQILLDQCVWLTWPRRLCFYIVSKYGSAQYMAHFVHLLQSSLFVP